MVIARGALAQAGAVVVRDVPPHSIVAGNPAQIVGYTVGGNDAAPTALKQAPATPGVVPVQRAWGHPAPVAEGAGSARKPDRRRVRPFGTVRSQAISWSSAFPTPRSAANMRIAPAISS